MKKLISISFLCVFVFALGCSGLKKTPRKSIFTFNYENQTYEIVSLNTASGEGTNILSLVGNGNAPLTAQDINQDGIIDVVLNGWTHIEEANKVYAAGIEAAQRAGNYQELQPSRTFEWKNELYTLVITTYYYSEAELNNLFTIRFHDTQPEAIFIDYNADGALDAAQKGETTLERAQNLYEATLLKGIDEGRITKTDLSYIVLKKPILAKAQISPYSFE